MWCKPDGAAKGGIVGVVVPYVAGMLHEQTRAWADGYRARALAIKLFELPASVDEAYWQLLGVAWSGGDDLVVVEQDIVPAPDVVDRMRACRRPWCASPYTIGTGTWLTDGLGCTKFAARLKSRHPDLIQHVGEIDNDGLPAKNWRRMDTRISQSLRKLGYRPHVHTRSIHLHDYGKRP